MRQAPPPRRPQTHLFWLRDRSLLGAVRHAPPPRSSTLDATSGSEQPRRRWAKPRSCISIPTPDPREGSHRSVQDPTCRERGADPSHCSPGDRRDGGGQASDGSPAVWSYRPAYAPACAGRSPGSQLMSIEEHTASVRRWVAMLEGDLLPRLFLDDTAAVRQLALHQLLDRLAEDPTVRQARAAAMQNDRAHQQGGRSHAASDVATTGAGVGRKPGYHVRHVSPQSPLSTCERNASVARQREQFSVHARRCYPAACPGAGIAPSCCSRPSVSNSARCSTT